MDRSRQEFAAMYDVRVKINPKICKLIKDTKISPESCLGDRTSNRAGARERKSLGGSNHYQAHNLIIGTAGALVVVTV